MRHTQLIALILTLFTVLSCEKEINLNLPSSKPELVVEACINDRFPTLNYVYLTQTTDYFSLKLDVGGLKGAKVFITEGELSGSDTIFSMANRVQMLEVTLSNIPPGLYINPLLEPRQGHIYKLEIYYEDKYIVGTTYLNTRTVIAKADYEVIGVEDGNNRAYLSFEYIDPPEPSFYRFAFTFDRDSNLAGWGASESFRILNDDNLNGQKREVTLSQKFTSGDTVNLYLGRIGRKEYQFWQSFNAVRNSEGPFSTPAQLKSNIKGAMGSFSGYTMDHKKVIIR